MKVLHYDAFTSKPNMGNPAGILIESKGLHENEMLKIAKKIGFNETVFIGLSKVADIRLRYFTPGHEIDLCGHGTMAALVAGYDNKVFNNVNTIETNAGILKIKMETTKKLIHIKMQQKPAKFIEFKGDIKKLAESLNLEESEIDSRYPIVYGSTGIWTLLVPIKKLDSFKKMEPHNKCFPEILKQNDHSSVHPFCLETYSNVDMHGRHFSSPYSGTIEDPATGTASGVMGAYFLKYISRKQSAELRIEQGQEIGKDAIIGVNVEFSQDLYHVEIEGTATFVRDIII